MNLEEIKSELRKLSELVGDWSEQRPIPPLERDLVLEKLRAIYEALRFGLDPSVIGVPKRVLPAAAVQPEPAAQARFRRPGRFEEEPDIEVVDLNEVLSLDEVAEPAEPASVPTGHAAAASGGYAAPAAEPAAPVVPVPEPEDEGPEVIEFVPEPEPAPVPRVAPAPRPQAAPVPPAYEVYEEPVREPAPAPVAAETPAPKPAPTPAPSPVPEPMPAPQPEVKPRPEEKPQGSGESQSLFGPDDEMMRRRHKQRVIMSLYDSDPKLAEPAAPKSKPAEPSAPKQEEPVAPAPVTPQAPAVAPRSSAAPADEPEIMLIDTGAEESAASTAEPEDEGPEILILDDESAEAPAPHLFASASQPAGTPAPRPAEVHAPAASRPVAPPAPAAPRSVEKPTAEAPSSVLGEVINHDVRTLGDAMSAPRKNYGAPVADLRQANDKFLMIRDLFGGNSVLFDATITALNAQKSLDDCMIYIAEHFAWNPDSESARLVMELLERKFA